MRLQFGLKPGSVAGFFDRPAVVSAVDKATLRVCRIAGYRVRQTARKSLKVKPYAKTTRAGTVRNVGAAGSPPIAHEREGLRRIYYAWDAGERATVVGPLLFKRKIGGKTLPEIHEFGATVQNDAGETLRYPRRPFMGPALDKHIGELPELWRDALARR